ncbi:FIT family protein scs3 [Golovinomyces cichoracearum]|uniref:Acyl-coenzyme A diphosphatase SCS3 n=1 Tax=Golovinomyces cichoracearum TaxID=62708 RepID=A0A420J8V7_9PEZI|nr:FIT family protein scs3 [Golovinomyces cichoracearum]
MDPVSFSKQRLQQMKTPSLVSTVTSSSSHDAPRIAKMVQRPSPYMPTSLEIFILSLYPATLIIGSLFSILDPAARNSIYNPATQSHLQNAAPSYFAMKNNIFNVLFVKKGWAWITFSYVFFLFSHPFTGPTESFSLTPKRLRGLLRFGVVTLWWIFVTQWFFGPPIIDRSFVFTGGQCERAESTLSHLEPRAAFLTAVACKAVGGQWRGGHDISGHVFLLVLGSMFIFEEVLHVALARRQDERQIIMKDGAIKSAETESCTGLPSESTGIWTLGSRIAVGVAMMSLYMLLMTAAYFHTWFEKLTGLTMAFIGIFAVYFLPRAAPRLRNVLAMPGI